LETALKEVYTAKLESKQATAMAALARAMVAVLPSGELEERIRELEDRIGGSYNEYGKPNRTLGENQTILTRAWHTGHYYAIAGLS